MRSKDVNHQWAVAQFRVKMDMVPGMVTYFWLTPTTQPGKYRRCFGEASSVGMAHFAMRGRVVVDEQMRFKLLSSQPTYSRREPRSRATLRQARRSMSCAAPVMGPRRG